MADCWFENLERRQYMAVQIASGSSVLLTTTQPDVVIEGTADAGVFVARTRLGSELFTVDPSRNLSISVTEGTSLNMRQLRTWAGLHIQTDDSIARISMSHVRLSGDLVVRTGAGDDQIYFDRIVVNGRFGMITGAGIDNVSLNRSAIARSFQLNTADDVDTVSIRRSVFRGKFWTDTGDADDSFVLKDSAVSGAGIIDGGPGADHISIARTVTRSSFNVTAAADDTVYREVWLFNDFAKGLSPWQIYAADYPRKRIVGEDGEGRPLLAEEAFELSYGLAQSPLSSQVLLLSGRNLSDDLMLFAARAFGPADGVVAGQSYRVRVELTLTASAPPGSISGHRLFFGAMSRAPEVKRTPDGGTFPRLVGNDGIRRAAYDNELQIIASSDVTDQSEGPSLIARASPSTVQVTADDNGRVWIAIGVDSVYETRFAANINSVRVVLQPVFPRE